METIRLGSKPVIGALDIGSTKVTFLVAEALQDGFKIVGKSSVKHDGVRQGAIVNISKTSEAIKKAKREAELNSGHELQEVYVSFGGLNVRSFDSTGMTAVKDQEVTFSDVESVLRTAQAVLLPEDREIIHVLPKEYILDGQREIQNPMGMRGVRLEAEVHLITGLRTAFPNILKCVEASGLKVKDFVLQQYASSQSILSSEEKDLGVALVEMGGGTCEWIVFEQGRVLATGAVAVGGANFTNDVSIGLRTPGIFAEKTKLDYGSCFLSAEQAEDSIEVEDVGGRGTRAVKRQNLVDIIAPRAQEAIDLVLSDIEKAGVLESLRAGLVLTGGASQLEGLADFASEQFQMPIRIGRPHATTSVNEVINTADFACALGLVRYAYSKFKIPRRDKAKANVQRTKSQVETSFKSFGKQFKDFIGL